MKLFTIIVMTILVIHMVFDQTPTTEARKLQEAESQNYFKDRSTNVFLAAIEGMKGVTNVQGLKDDFKEAKGLNLPKDGFTNAFRPTSPGDSPGIGHKGIVNIHKI